MKNIVLVLLLWTTYGLSQQESTKLQDYLPPSPEAQEFIKYGEYPVGMYTGVPNISLPLYTITSKEIEVPISLSYHASGIQVDQIASWVGLGWSLNAGGMISKIPRGIPDDEGNGYLAYNVPELSELVFDQAFYEDAATGKRDTESDIYHYNFNGYSGKFFFDRDKNIQLIEAVPLKISYVPSSPGVSSKFIITTEKGIEYEFGDTERTQSISATATPGSGQDYVSSWHLSKIVARNKIDTITFSYSTGSPFDNNQYGYEESTGDDISISSCTATIQPNVHAGYGVLSSQQMTTQNPERLTEIIFPNGKIVFTVATGRSDSSNERLSEIKIYQKSGAAYQKIKSYNLIHDYYYSSQSTVYPINPPTYKRYRLKLTELHELDANGSNPKKHVFGYNTTMLPPLETNGKDYWGYYNGKNTNVTLVPLQPVPYLGNNVGTADRNPDAISMKAGVLNKITYPTGGYTEFHYEPHEYITTENSLINKTKNVFAVGLENVIGNGVYLEDTEVFTPNRSGYATISIEASDWSSGSGVFPRVTLKRAGSPVYLIDHSISPTTYSYPLNPPEVSFSFPPVWLDEGVTYTFKAEAEGTSNSMEFDGAAYMKADIDYKEVSTTPTQVTKLAGGLRIQQIKSFDADGSFVFSKRYEYNSANLITPEIFLNEQYLDEQIQGFAGCCVSAIGNRRFYYGGTVQSLTLDGGSPVVYGQVDEFMVDNSNNDIGKTRYNYDIQTDAVIPAPSSYQGGIMLLKKDWMGGQNTSVVTFPKNSANYITSEAKGHTLKKYDESYMMYKIVHSRKIIGGGSCTDAGRFAILEYPIIRGTKLISSSIKKIRDINGDEVTETTSIFYDNDIHLQPTRTEMTKSNGDKVFREIKYPDDVTATTSLGLPYLTNPEKNILDRLKTDDLHQVDFPIQTEVTVKNSGGTILSKSKSRTLYMDLGNDLVLPEFFKTLKGDYNATTNPLDDRLVYLGYDNNGNPIEVSQANGAHVYYIWGYDGTLPIAKLENVEGAQITPALQTLIDVAITASNNDDDRTYGSGGAEGALRTALDNIRDHSSMASALVTTYTYDRLLGITSTTDPSGYTMYYQYDNFNRLKEIRDAGNNLVSDYQYHYKGQN